MLQARRIRHRERDAALETVVEAISADPQVRWWFPDDAGYADAARRFFGMLLDTRIDGGEVWVVDDLAAVSMWIPPGGNLLGPDDVAARYTEMVATLPDPAPQRIAETDELVDLLLPQEPFWYLGVLACRPGAAAPRARQRRPRAGLRRSRSGRDPGRARDLGRGQRRLLHPPRLRRPRLSDAVHTGGPHRPGHAAGALVAPGDDGPARLTDLPD